jgi:hypothetical protein
MLWHFEKLPQIRIVRLKQLLQTRRRISTLRLTVPVNRT